MRNQRTAVCPACGDYIPNRHELPFLTRRYWRDRVADTLGYDKDFIRSLGEGTRIYAKHFLESDIRDGKPIGMFFIYIVMKMLFFFIFVYFIKNILIIGLPQFNIRIVEGWPLGNNPRLGPIEVNDVDVCRIDVDDPEETDEKEDPEPVLVELNQLKLLMRQCYYCSNSVNKDRIKWSSSITSNDIPFTGTSGIIDGDAFSNSVGFLSTFYQ